MNEKECRRIVEARSEGLCEVCGKQGHSVHHRRKRSAGGPWSPSNCIKACGSGVTGCHGWIEAHPKDAMDRGLWVSRYADECEVPVLCWYGRVVLDDSGGFEVVE